MIRRRAQQTPIGCIDSSFGPAQPLVRACRAAAIFVILPLVALGASVEGHVALAQTRAAPVVNQRYEIVSKAGVLATNPPTAIVYLEGNFAAPLVPPVVQVAQKDLMFVPSVLAIQTGTKVEFPNLDPVYHNIFSFSPPKRFDLGRYRSDEKPVPSVVFDKPGLVTLRCDIHEHMRALVLVVATPYFVVTDPTGNYRLDGVPAGHYVVKAWLDSRTTREQPIDLSDGATATANFDSK